MRFAALTASYFLAAFSTGLHDAMAVSLAADLAQAQAYFLAAELRARVAAEVAGLLEADRRVPGLAVVLVGGDPATPHAQDAVSAANRIGRAIGPTMRFAPLTASCFLHRPARRDGGVSRG